MDIVFELFKIGVRLILYVAVVKLYFSIVVQLASRAFRFFLLLTRKAASRAAMGIRMDERGAGGANRGK